MLTPPTLSMVRLAAAKPASSMRSSTPPHSRVRMKIGRAIANAFLAEYVAAHNRRFAKRPPGLPSAWRPAPRDLPRLLSCRYSRTVARDNTVTLGERVVSLAPRARGRSWATRRLEVREFLDGRLVVFADGAPIAHQAAPAPFTLVPRRLVRADHVRLAASPSTSRPPHSPQEPRSARGRSSPLPKSRWRPAATHPWLESLRYHVARKNLRAQLRSTANRRGDISIEQ